MANQREQQVRQAVDSEYATDRNKNEKDDTKDNIVWTIINSSLPAPEKEYERVARECSSVTLAGTETAGSSLAVTTFLLLSHPSKLNRLRKELEHAELLLGRKPTYKELRELPYLVSKVAEYSTWIRR